MSLLSCCFCNYEYHREGKGGRERDDEGKKNANEGSVENTSNCFAGSGNVRKSSTGREREEEARLRTQVRNAGNGRSDRRPSGKTEIWG